MKVFEDIYTKYKDDVYKFLCKLTGYRFDLAEELLQETFYQAFISFNRFRGDCEIKTWVCQIAKNTYYSYIRNEIMKEKLANKIINEEVINDFTEQAEKKEIIQLIHKIMKDFDERTKNIVLYRMYADLKFSEIGTLLGIKESSAKVIYSRAKVKIREQLKERFGYEI
ncbi:MAG: polymerase, sigma-24 subunit, subfamily [Anaerocolumna sp.]|nr:polymerase, sigma-24 subunit, subfamily [Anaerocolumna sp.]